MSLLEELDSVSLEEVKPKKKKDFKVGAAYDWFKDYNPPTYTDDPGPSFFRENRYGWKLKRDYINDSIDNAKKIEKYILDKENFK